MSIERIAPAREALPPDPRGCSVRVCHRGRCAWSAPSNSAPISLPSERAGRPDLGGVARAHQHHLGTGETSAAAAARLRWCLRAPSLPPAAWRCWTSPRRCWVRDRRASTRRHRFKLKRLSGTPGRVFVAGRNVIMRDHSGQLPTFGANSDALPTFARGIHSFPRRGNSTARLRWKIQ